MTETGIYDKHGLFHNIVKQSASINGRYFLLPNGDKDLNSNNIGNIELPEDKYPLVGCLTPTSLLNSPVSDGQWEYFPFRLLFLTTSETTGDHQFRNLDRNTNTSQVSTGQNWQEMKAAALAFMNALEQIQPRLRGVFQLDQREKYRIVRITKMQNDKVSGVMLSFTGMLASACTFPDITPEKIDAIQIPT